MRAVVLELPAGADNVMTRVTLEASDDLRQWTTLAAGASVLRLAAGGERLEQLRIEFPARKAKYLRLTWPGRGTALELAGLAVEPGETIVEAPRQWQEMPGDRGQRTGRASSSSTSAGSFRSTGCAWRSRSPTPWP